MRRVPRGPRSDSRGSVTAEAALALPALLVVVWAVLAAISAGVAQLRCIDAAREGARAAARGESATVTTATARSAAPRAATVTVRRDGTFVVVRVAARVRPLGNLLPALSVSGQAAAYAESELGGAGEPGH